MTAPPPYLLLAVVGSALMLAGCAPPIVTGASSDQVVIKYDPAVYDPAKLQPQAEEECGRYGKRAVYRTSKAEGIGGLGFYYARFDCVERVE